MKNLRAFFFVLASFSCCSCVSATFSRRQPLYPLNFILGNENLGPLNNGVLGEAQAPGPAFNEPKVPLILAGNRTKRPDILRKFRIYQSGWDISNKHYWASVAFTGVAGFIITLVWLISFGLTLLVHHCFGWRICFKGKGSPHSEKIRLGLLVLFSCASMVGCILLSVGQLQLHSEVLHTLKYVVNQSDYTAQMLRNVSDYLSLAKSVNVPQFKLPQSAMQEMDELHMRLSSGADTLTEKTNQNSVKVRRVFNTVRSALITVASVMLVLVLLGLGM